MARHRRPLGPDERVCRIDGCSTIHKRNLFACAYHWHRLPAELKAGVWAAYAGPGLLSDEYAQAAEAAEAFLEDRDPVDVGAVVTRRRRDLDEDE